MRSWLWVAIKLELKAFVLGFASALLVIGGALWLSGRWPCRGACTDHVNPPRHVEAAR